MLLTMTKESSRHSRNQSLSSMVRRTSWVQRMLQSFLKWEPIRERSWLLLPDWRSLRITSETTLLDRNNIIQLIQARLNVIRNSMLWMRFWISIQKWFKRCLRHWKKSLRILHQRLLTISIRRLKLKHRSSLWLIAKQNLIRLMKISQRLRMQLMLLWPKVEKTLILSILKRSLQISNNFSFQSKRRWKQPQTPLTK